MLQHIIITNEIYILSFYFTTIMWQFSNLAKAGRTGQMQVVIWFLIKLGDQDTKQDLLSCDFLEIIALLIFQSSTFVSNIMGISWKYVKQVSFQGCHINYYLYLVSLVRNEGCKLLFYMCRWSEIGFKRCKSLPGLVCHR